MAVKFGQDSCTNNERHTCALVLLGGEFDSIFDIIGSLLDLVPRL